MSRNEESNEALVRNRMRALKDIRDLLQQAREAQTLHEQGEAISKSVALIRTIK